MRLPTTRSTWSRCPWNAILGLVALGAWAWDMLRKGGRIRRTPVDWLILAFLIWMAVTTATSIHWPTSLFGTPQRYEGLLTFITYALIYFLVLQFADDAARVRRLAGSLFWASVIVACYALLQFLGVDYASKNVPLDEVNRAFSTYGNPNMLGGFLIFSLSVALALALFERRSLWRLVYWVGFGLNGLALIVSFTRGAWIGGFVALGLLGVIARRQRLRPRRVDWVPAGACLAAGIAIIWRSLFNGSEVMNFGKRLASIFQFGSGSGQTRTEIWRAAAAAIRQRPVFGWGADTFGFVFSKFKPVEYVRDAGGRRGADNAHDYPLQLASGVGIMGAVILYGVFVWAGVRSFKTVFSHSSDSTRIIVGAFWAASAGYLVHLFFGISVTGVSFLLWIALALVLAPTSRSKEVKARKWGTIVAALVLLIVALGVGYQGVLLAADNAYLHAKSDPTFSQRASEARKAVRLNPFDPQYRSAVGLVYLEDLAANMRAAIDARNKGEDPAHYDQAVKSDFANAESAFKDAIAFAPDEYENYVNLAAIYNAGGSVIDKDLFQKSIDVAEEGLKVMPFGTAIRVRLAQALLGTGKTSEAVDTLEYCVKIDPRDGDAALLLASLYGEQGRSDDALALLKSVDALLPGQPGVADAITKLESGATSP